MTLLLFRTLASCCHVFSTPHPQLLLRLCSTRSFQYQLCAIITHTGTRPTNGHYRAVLCSCAAGFCLFLALALCHHLLRAYWYCDDDKRPCIRNALSHATLREGYLFFLPPHLIMLIFMIC